MKTFSVRVIKLGQRKAGYISIEAESEHAALKAAEEKLGARYGVIAATEVEEDNAQVHKPMEQ